ncbi:DNA-directed RNA polymerase subunit B'' [Candidatus Micrarchaeota archaeon]|nr:DNA-directed RNA polymerase subunit B'' [Candidatus Micrarchaeota archaeon]
MDKELLSAYFQDNSLVRQHLESYNKFVEQRLQSVINKVGFVEPNIEGYMLKFGRVRLEKPMIVEADGSRRSIVPMEARLRDLTYAAPIFLEIIPVINGIERRIFSEVFIGELPVMVKSKLCHLEGLNEDELIDAGEDANDTGGYFIINGSERVLVSIEDLAPNRIMVTKEKDGAVINSKVFSTRFGFRTRCVVERSNEGILSVTFPAAPANLNLITILRALGLKTDEQIFDAFASPSKIRSDIMLNLEVDETKTKEDAFELIGKKAAPGQAKEYRQKRAEILLDTYLLPHLGVDPKDRVAKSHYLVKMAEKSIRVFYRKVAQDDKDHYMNKRIKLTGNLMEELFRYAFQFLIKDVAYQVERAAARGRRLVVQTMVRPDALSERIRYSMATGNWIAGQTGVSQLLDRTNHLSAVSHLRRIISPLSRKHPHFKARDLHGTHWGKLCVGKDTNVLLFDGFNTRTMDELSKCWKHNCITTFDENKSVLTPSIIADYQALDAAQAGKRVFSITAESGRQIIATEDHPFLTEHGWKDAGKLALGEKVLVIPAIDSIAESLPENTPVDNILTKYLPKDSLTPAQVKWEKLSLLARLFGFTLADGSIGRTIEWNCGCAEDAAAINSDLKRLGFDVNESKPCTTSITFEGRTTAYKTHRITKGGQFLKMFLELGAPTGRRTDSDYCVPKWIMNAPRSVKREFLAGFFGGDGSMPIYVASRKKKNKFRIPLLVQHKRSENVESGAEFLRQVSILLAEFKVDSKVKISSTPEYSRKDGAQMVKLSLEFGASRSNVANVTQKIGYRYCKKKSEFSNLAGEYLRVRSIAKTTRHALKETAKKMHSSGSTPKQISEKLGIKLRAIKSWLYSERYLKTRFAAGMTPDFNEWVKHCRKPAVVPEKIVSINEVNVTDVRDFTTASPTHTFIANGFIVHNCPNESPEGPSCALVKNMALLCEISTGDEEKSVEVLVKKLGVSL